MKILGIASVTAITVICFLLASAVKATKIPNKWLPTICGAAGAALGALALYIMPGYPASDLLTAIAVGIVSGFAATGGYEAIKQLRKAA